MKQNNSVNDMATILRKLHKVESGTHVASKNSNLHETAAMADVLRKLKDVTDRAVNSVVSDHKHDSVLEMAVNTTKTIAGVSVAQYEITTAKKQLVEGVIKTFYNIVDTGTQEVLYKDLALFESAMGIVKNLLYVHNPDKVTHLANLDAAYMGCLIETYAHKQKLKQLNENSVKFDVVTAKYSNSMTKMKMAKMQILKSL